MLVFACTSMYRYNYLSSLCWLISLTSFVHQTLVTPLKDVKDLEGDLKAGRKLLVTKLPLNLIKLIAAVGYIVPWIVQIWLLKDYEGNNYFTSVIFKLQILSALMCFGGVYLTWLIFCRPQIFQWDKFGWVAELLLLYIFQLSLPF